MYIFDLKGLHRSYLKVGKLLGPNFARTYGVVCQSIPNIGGLNNVGDTIRFGAMSFKQTALPG